MRAQQCFVSDNSRKYFLHQYGRYMLKSSAYALVMPSQHQYSLICYKYQLSNQYTHQYSHKNIAFYSQRQSKHYSLCTQLRTLYKHLMNNSWVEWMMGANTKAHISSFGPHTHTPAWLGDWTLTPKPRTSGTYSLHYKPPSTWLYSLGLSCRIKKKEIEKWQEHVNLLRYM